MFIETKSDSTIPTTAPTPELLTISLPEPIPVSLSKPEEEWVWVEGYKGTDKDMKCRDYQYEFGVQYDMPEGKEIKECESGFHLCLNLRDVFTYYNIGYSHRFFKVTALVRKSDKDNYNHYENSSCGFVFPPTRNDKIVAKSIILESELTIDEILKGTAIENLPDKYKQLAIKQGTKYALQEYQTGILIEDGYGEIFARYIVDQNKFEKAHAFGSQKDLSMDMKVLGIFCH